LDKKNIISDTYRNQVDALLENQPDLDLFDSLNQEDLDKIWKEISVEMDIDEVWNGISSDLDSVMPLDSGSGMILKSIATFLIILVGMIPVKKAIPDSGISQLDILNETRQNEQSSQLFMENSPDDTNSGEQVNGNIIPALRSSSFNREGDIKTILEVSNIIGLSQETPVFSIEPNPAVLSASEIADSNLFVTPDNSMYENSGFSPVLLPDDLEKMKMPSKTDPYTLKIIDNPSTGGFSLPPTDRGRISGGLITLVRNTWLLNYETLEGLKSESLNTTEFVFFPDVGLSLSYSLNKTWLIQTDGFFSSNAGQEYFGYYRGHYTRKIITLNYSTVALSVKHRFIRNGDFMPRYSINVFTGGYLSVLHYAYQKLNTNLENIGSQYKNFDLGIRVGGELELRIFDQLSLAPGLLMSFGIPNIYKGCSSVPGYLRRTHNGAVDFQLVIYYHFN